MLPNKQFRLSTIYFNPTSLCNLRCKHCWLSCGCISKGNYDSNSNNHITLRQLKPAIKEALSLGLQSIKITGGEPFLRKDIFSFIEYFYTQDLLISIETNATLIDNVIAKKLKKYKVFQVAVSLDSHSEEEHDRFRGVKGSFKKATRGIKLLVKHDIPVQIIFSLHKGNLKSIFEIISLTKRLNADSLKINPVVPMGRADELNKENGLLSIKETIQLLKDLERKLLDKEPLDIYFDIPPAFMSISYLRVIDKSRCYILNLLGILPDGGVSICGVGMQDEKLVIGNITRDSLKHIWQNSTILKDLRENVPMKLEGVCKDCIMKYACLGDCRAYVYTVSRDFKSPFPFCQEAFDLNLFPKLRLINHA